MNTPPEHPRPILVPVDRQTSGDPPSRIESPPPENTFNKWLRRLGLRMTGILSIGVISTAASTIYTAVKNSWFTEAAKPKFGWLIPIISIIQLAVIIFVLVSSIKGPNWLHEDEENESPSFDDESLPGRTEKGDTLIKACGYKGLPKAKWSEAKKIAASAEDHYQILWKCLWFCWLLLYITLAIQNIPSLFIDPTRESGVRNVSLMYGLDILSTFINNCAAVVILLTYFVLSKPTASINKKGTNKLYIEVIRWFTIAVVFSIMEGAFLAVALGVFDNSVINTAQSLSQYNQIESAFTWASGIFSATAMALYV
jgi:hypothetical protein